MHNRAMNGGPLRSQKILACLGDESRFRVMLELVRGDRCVTDLAERVGLSQSCTTRHLQVLEREGLVRSARSGKRVFFSVSTEPRVVSLLAWALPSEPPAGAALDGRPGRRGRVRATLPTGDSPPAESADAGREAASETEARVVSDLEDFLL